MKKLVWSSFTTQEEVVFFIDFQNYHFLNYSNHPIGLLLYTNQEQFLLEKAPAYQKDIYVAQLNAQGNIKKEQKIPFKFVKFVK